ncbi:MAG: DMT family transporter [Candidatus Gracilibacteria bacterium]
MIKAYVALLLSVFLWGINFSITKIGLFEVEPITLAFLRFFVASVLLVSAVFIVRRGKELKKAFVQDALFFMWLGFLGVALLFILENFALKYTTTSEASILMSCEVLLIAVLAYFFLGEKMSGYKMGGVALGFLGIFLVMFNQKDFLSLIHSQSFFGNILAFFSSLMWGIYTIMSKKRVQKYDPLVVVTMASIFGMLFLFLAMILFEGLPVITEFSIKAWFVIAWLGVIVSGVCYYLWNYALKYLDASKAGIYMFLMPVIATVFGLLIFDEKLTLQMVLGAGLVFGGIYLTEKA